MFIVWTDSPVAGLVATTKKTKLAAVRAYNEIDRTRGSILTTYGWSIAEDAEPRVRVAVGLTPYA